MLRSELATMLRAVADDVESGDCLGASITFNAMYGVDKGKAELVAVIREGNLAGMGGVFTYGYFEPNGILESYMGLDPTDPDTEAELFKLLPKI